MKTTVKVDERGELRLTSELLGGARPHTRFEVERMGEGLLIRPETAATPQAQREAQLQPSLPSSGWRHLPTAAARAEAFERWTEELRRQLPPRLGPLPDEALDRETMYD